MEPSVKYYVQWHNYCNDTWNNESSFFDADKAERFLLLQCLMTPSVAWRLLKETHEILTQFDATK